MVALTFSFDCFRSNTSSESGDDEDDSCPNDGFLCVCALNVTEFVLLETVSSEFMLVLGLYVSDDGSGLVNVMREPIACLNQI